MGNDYAWYRIKTIIGGYGSILFKELLKKCKEIGYKEIKLFPMKTNEPTIKIMLKNGGQIIGDFKNQKHIIRIPLEWGDGIHNKLP